MDNELISIIVPVYNVEKYLDKCLDSLVKQEIDDYEVIVVNDGTNDNSTGKYSLNIKSEEMIKL